MRASSIMCINGIQLLMLMADEPLDASYPPNYLLTACTRSCMGGGTQPSPACNQHARRTQPQAVLLTCSSIAWQSLALFTAWSCLSWHLYMASD